MTKTFNEVYRPKSPDEQKFVDKHVVIKHADRNGNGDDLFNAKKTKYIKRKKESHGYDPGEDAKVYESNIDEGRGGITQHQRLVYHPSVQSVDTTGAHPYFVHLKPGHFVNYNKRFGAKSAAEALRMLKGVTRDKESFGENVELHPKIYEGTAGRARQRKAHIALQDKRAAKAATAGKNLSKDPDTGTPDHFTSAQRRKRGLSENVESIENSLLEYFDEIGQEIEYEELQELALELHDEIDSELNELSQSTLKSYIHGAATNMRDNDERGKAYVRYATSGDTRLNKPAFLNKAADHAVKSVKRVKGIAKAANKLTKENLDNIVNALHKEEITIEEALVEKIAHLSEKHQELILTLFDSLSEDNQELLFHTLDEEDGINETIDFALENNLQELSKKTLGSYIKKASNDKANSAYYQGSHNGSGDSNNQAKRRNNEKKRTIGISRAVNKVVNESAKSYKVEGEHKKEGYTKSYSYFADSPAHAKEQFHDKHSKDEYSVKKVTRLKEETLDEISSSRNLDSIKRANHNITNLSKGIKPEVKKTLTWKQHMASYDKEEKAKYHEHKAHYEHHKAELKDLHNTYKDLHSGNLGISKDDKVGQQGAEEEIESMKDHHRAKLTYHLNKMHYHNSNLSKPLKIKEEVEHLDELSKDTLKSYNKKALRSAEKSWEKSSDEEDKAMSTDGEKYPDKQHRHQNNAIAHEKKYFKRTKGIERASQRLISMMKDKK